MNEFSSIRHWRVFRGFCAVFMCFAVISAIMAQPILPGTYVTSLRWSKDGSLLAYGTGEIIAPWGDYGTGGGSARVIEQSGTIIFSMNFPYPINNVEVSPSGNLVFAGASRNVFDLITQQLVVGPSDSIAFNDGTWHPTSDLLLLTTVLGTRTYDPLNKETLGGLGRRQLPFNPSAEVKTVTSVWSPDATSAATSTTQGSIFIWDITQEVAATVQTTFSAHTAAVQRLVWNAETNLIASGDDSGKIWVWNPATGQPVLELSGHVGAILALDWRSDGQQLISSGVDGTVRVWDWPSGAMQVVASGNIVSAIAYSPDGSELAYAGEVTDPDAILITTIPVESLVQPTPTPIPTSTPTPTPTPVRADAGIDQFCIVSRSGINPFGGSAGVTLDGSGSVGAVGYAWHKVSGSPNLPRLISTRPVISVLLGAGTHVYSLTVTGAGGQTHTDSVTVTVASSTRTLPGCWPAE